jgi:hypothetical protein
MKSGILLLSVLLLIAEPSNVFGDVITFNDLIGFKAVAGTLTLINFDVTPVGTATVSGTPIGDTYASLGAVFPTGNYFEGGFTGPVSPPNGWINDTLDAEDRVFGVAFFTPVMAVGVHNVLFGGQPYGSRLLAYDASLALLGTAFSDTATETRDFFGLISDNPISSIEVRVAFAQGWGLDDLSFGPGTSVVPEPASLMLFSTGLTYLFGRRLVHRRRYYVR